MGRDAYLHCAQVEPTQVLSVPWPVASQQSPFCLQAESHQQPIGACLPQAESQGLPPLPPPQSAGQLLAVSPDSQAPLPHWGVVPPEQPLPLMH